MTFYHSTYHSCARIRKDVTSNQYSVIVAGGQTSSGNPESVEILDEDSDVWRSSPTKLPVTIHSTSIVEYQGGALLICGKNESEPTVNTIFSKIIYTIRPINKITKKGLA